MTKRRLPQFGRRDAGNGEIAAGAAPPAPDMSGAARIAASAPMARLRSLCLARLDPAIVVGMTPERLSAEMDALVASFANEHHIELNTVEQRQLSRELTNDITGLGPLEPLLEDDSIADVMVNGPNNVFIERKGRVYLSDVQFRDAAHVINICQRIAAAVGRRIDESQPMVDARLADGSRVNIVFPPLALDGPYLSIRKFSRRVMSFSRLVETGSCSMQVAGILQLAARARLNVVISGGTGSGKTTLMNAMSELIDAGERIVTVEDAAELRLQQPHVVRMETRPPSLEGKGEVTQRDLMRNALRMRPDRIIIGEVRGAEAFDMLQAMNTGHDGSMATVHANTSRDALTRIENMVQMGDLGLPSAAIRTQIVSAVDLIVQVARQRDGTRRITQITNVMGMEGDVIVLDDIARYEVTGEGSDGRLVGDYVVRRSRPSFFGRLVYFHLDAEWAGILGAAE